MSSSKHPRSPSPTGSHSSNTGPHPKRSKLPSSKSALSSFAQFESDVTEAANKVIPTGYNQYGKVVVLAVTWKKSDLKLTWAKTQLLETFRNLYGYSIESFELDPDKDKSDIGVDITTWLGQQRQSYGSSDPLKPSLFILYYSGHGDWRSDSKDLIVYANANVRNKCYLEWDSVTRVLFENDKNAYLALMDCCNAGMAYHKDKIELLGASAWANVAASAEKDNFSTAINDQLVICHGTPISVVQLYGRLMKFAYNYDSAQPIYLPGYGTNRQSIVLSSLRANNPALPMIQSMGKRAVVTISVTIASSDTVPSSQEFIKWVTTHMPRDLQSFEIRTSWVTASTRVVIAIPVEVWARLRSRPEYTFESHDLMGSFGPTSTPSTREEPMPLMMRSMNVGQSSSSRK